MASVLGGRRMLANISPRFLQAGRLLSRPFATAFDPEKFSARFETDTEEIVSYFSRGEKLAWKQHKHRPLKNPESTTDHFVVGNKGFRQIVLGDKLVGSRLMKWLGPMFWVMRDLPDIYAVVIRGGTHTLTLPHGSDYGEILKLQREEKSHHPFFRDWTRLVYQAARFHRPLICCFAGKVRGSMAGFMMHSPYRIAFDDAVFFLPQTEQGFFPDSGMTYVLPRLDGAMGMYLALTGKKLFGSDLVHAGIATHFMETNNFPTLIQHLEENSGFAGVTHNILEWHDRFDIKSTAFSLETHLSTIDRCFSHDSVEEIFLALDQEPKEGPSAKFVEKTIRVLRAKSPLSLKVTHMALKQGEQSSLENCLKMEYKLAVKMSQTADFKEGVEALFEKRHAKWAHASLADVSTEEVRKLFKRVSETGDARKAADLELSLPIHDFEPDTIRTPKWGAGEMFKAESHDPEANEMTRKSIEQYQASLAAKDITEKWFEFDTPLVIKKKTAIPNRPADI